MTQEYDQVKEWINDYIMHPGSTVCARMYLYIYTFVFHRFHWSLKLLQHSTRCDRDVSLWSPICRRNFLICIWGDRVRIV